MRPLDLSLRLLPIITGTVWVITLLSLLIYWLAEGRPRYPSQQNPNIAFISDIGAFRLRPLFIAGGTISAIALLGSMLSVHVTRYYRYRAGSNKGSQEHGDIRPDSAQDRGKHEGLTRAETLFSSLACVFAIAACPVEVCLTIFDNHLHTDIHHLLLFLAFMGTGLSAVCTTIGIWLPSALARSRDDKREEKLYSHALNTMFFGLVILAGTLFTIFLRHQYYWTGGILEWIMAFLMTFYFWTLAGLIEVPLANSNYKNAAEEATPLLR